MAQAFKPPAGVMGSASAAGGTPPTEESIGELLKQLAGDTSTLVRQEIALAQAELVTKGKAAGKAAALLAGAFVMVFAVLVALTLLLYELFALIAPLWLAALAVTLIFLVAVAGLALSGLKLLRAAMPPKPEQTVETLKEDVEWAKTLPPSGAK